MLPVNAEQVLGSSGRCGDMKNTCDRFFKACRRINFHTPPDFASLSSGDAKHLLTALHHALMTFTTPAFKRTYNEYFLDFFGCGKTDRKVVKGVFKLTRTEWSYKPRLTIEKFFQRSGFAEHKVLFVTDVLVLVAHVDGMCQGHSVVKVPTAPTRDKENNEFVPQIVNRPEVHLSERIQERRRALRDFMRDSNIVKLAAGGTIEDETHEVADSKGGDVEYLTDEDEDEVTEIDDRDDPAEIYDDSSEQNPEELMVTLLNQVQNLSSSMQNCMSRLERNENLISARKYIH